jgi:hypothetical protein
MRNLTIIGYTVQFEPGTTQLSSPAFASVKLSGKLIFTVQDLYLPYLQNYVRNPVIPIVLNTKFLCLGRNYCCILLFLYNEISVPHEIRVYQMCLEFAFRFTNSLLSKTMSCIIGGIS